MVTFPGRNGFHGRLYDDMPAALQRIAERLGVSCEELPGLARTVDPSGDLQPFPAFVELAGDAAARVFIQQYATRWEAVAAVAPELRAA